MCAQQSVTGLNCTKMPLAGQVSNPLYIVTMLYECMQNSVCMETHASRPQCSYRYKYLYGCKATPSGIPVQTGSPPILKQRMSH